MTRTREWSLHNYWNRLLPTKGRFAQDFAQASEFPATDADVTNEMLAESYVTVARLVEVHGEG